MLTMRSIINVIKQQSAYGEGPRQPIPRDSHRPRQPPAKDWKLSDETNKAIEEAERQSVVKPDPFRS